MPKVSLYFFYLDTIFFFMQRSKEECEKDTGEMKGVTTTALDLVKKNGLMGILLRYDCFRLQQ